MFRVCFSVVVAASMLLNEYRHFVHTAYLLFIIHIITNPPIPLFKQGKTKNNFLDSCFQKSTCARYSFNDNDHLHHRCNNHHDFYFRGTAEEDYIMRTIPECVYANANIKLLM